MKLKQRRIWQTETISYIRLEWGSMQKINHFTKEFKAKYNGFCRFFEENRKSSSRKGMYCLLTEIENAKIPIMLYDGLTNKPYKNTTEVWRYLVHYWLGEDKR
jgi:hypothetical protein